jgi:hypothetical protein
VRGEVTWGGAGEFREAPGAESRGLAYLRPAVAGEGCPCRPAWLAGSI